MYMCVEYVYIYNMYVYICTLYMGYVYICIDIHGIWSMGYVANS